MSGESSTFDPGSEYARVDLITNHTVFQSDNQYQALVRGEELPVHTFSSFIHEATHHWCFISPVGTALSVLYLSVAKRALHWAVTGDDSQLREALDDLCAFEIAVRWLRPLQEGLAQFAEYDVRPDVVGSASLISPPLLGTLSHLFDLRGRLDSSRHQDESHVLYKLADDIDRWRLSRQTIERKSELLLQPAGSRGSAYLLGYLTVKSLWKNAARFYEEFGHADHFLMLVRKLVLGDYALVAAILDRTQSGHRRGLRLGELLYQRLELIRFMPFEDEVPWSDWEETLTPSPTLRGGGLVLPDPQPFAGLDTQAAMKEGVSKLFEYYREVLEPVDWLDRLPVRYPPSFFENVVRERYLMWLGECPARWQSTGPRRGRIVMGDDVVVDDFKLEHASDEGLGELRLDIYVDLYEGYRLTTVAREQGVFGFVSSPKVDDSVTSELVRARLDRREIAGISRLLREAMPHYTRGTNYRDVLEEFWRADGLDLLDATYMGFAFDFDARIGSALANGGISRVLDDDPELVRTVAAITLAASAGMTPEGLKANCPELPLDPRDAIRDVGARWEFDDFPLARITQDGFLSSAF